MAQSQIVYIRRVANENEPPNRIVELREAKGLTQEELARLAHVHQTTLSKVERGQRKLDQVWMRRLAPHLGVSPAELLPKSDNPLMLTEEERELILRLRSVDQQARSTFERVADAVLPFTARPQKGDAA